MPSCCSTPSNRGKDEPTKAMVMPPTMPVRNGRITAAVIRAAVPPAWEAISPMAPESCRTSLKAKMARTT
jgi:hypothetical protein